MGRRFCEQTAPAITDELTAEGVQSFRALGVEILLYSEALGELWLVPAYTDQARAEITPEDAATIVRALAMFPARRSIRSRHA